MKARLKEEMMGNEEEESQMGIPVDLIGIF